MEKKKPVISEANDVSNEPKEYVAPEVTYIEFDFTERIMASVCKEYYVSIPALNIYYTHDERNAVCLD